MVALPLRTLELDDTLGLDLDRRSALGVRPVALWPMGDDRRTLGLGSRRLLSAPPLHAGSGRVPRNTGDRLELRRRGRRRVVPAGAWRNLLAELHPRRGLCSQ